MSKPVSSETMAENCDFIKNLKFCECGDKSGDSLPPIICLLAAMTNPDISGDPCVLLPTKGRVAALTALVTAFQAAKSRFPELLESYIESFEAGERVRVLPSGHVYIFNGQTEREGQKFFMLRLLNDPTAKRSFPLTEAVRLEKTTAARPIGRGERFGDFQISDLDRILCVESGGNAALFENEVILVSKITSFKKLIESIYITISGNLESKFLLNDVLPWGAVNAVGELEFRNSPAASGAPLIAVASKPEYAAMFCQNSGNKNPRVIVDGATPMKNSLQALDNIVEKGKLLLIADHSEMDLLPEFEKRGCAIWSLPKGQRRLVDTRGSVLNSLSISRRRSDQFNLKISLCNSEAIDDAAESLFKAYLIAKKKDDYEALRNLVSGGFSCLLSVSPVLHNMSVEEQKGIRSRLDEVRHQLKIERTWLPEEAHREIDNAITHIEAFVESPNTHKQNSKQEILLDLLRQEFSRGANPTILASKETAVVSAHRFLADRLDRDVQITTLGAYLAKPDSQPVIITGWPLTRWMKRFVYAYATDTTYILAYDFEKRWFESFVTRRTNNLARWNASTARLEKFTGIDFPDLVGKGFSAQPHPRIPREETGDDETPSDQIRLQLDRVVRKGNPPTNVSDPRKARYVSFLGRTYAHLTETHNLPYVTDIVRGVNLDKSVVPMVTIDGLGLGDFVLFRVQSDGNSDIIRHLAEALVGESKYQRVREASEEWKDVLRSISDSPRVIAEKLAEVGLIRAVNSISTWINDPNRIGPMNKEDLFKIYLAAGELKSDDKASEVWKSISSIRGAHIQAGNRLGEILLKNLPGKVPEISDSETIVELSSQEMALGKIAIVEVEYIGSEVEERSYLEVNRLLWDAT